MRPRDAVVRRKERPQRPQRSRLLPCGASVGVGLLRSPFGQGATSSSSTLPRRTFCALPAPAPTTPSAPYRRATPPKKRHRRLRTRVSPLLSATPKSVHRLTGVRLGLLPHLLALPVPRIDGSAAIEPPWVKLCSPFPCFLRFGPPAQVGRPT
jgi:hypothetical protein